MITGLYDDEPLILARLNDTDYVPDGTFKTISSASEVSGVDSIAEYLDAVFILPGDFVDMPKDAGRDFVIGREWDVVVAVKHIRDPKGVETTASRAGEKMKHVIRALHGFGLDDNFKEKMKFSRLETPVYLRGWAEFPIIFTNRIALTKPTGG